MKFNIAPTPDDDSVDATISTRGLRGVVRSPRLDIQLKCHLGLANGDPIAYPLKPKNYEDLRHQDYAAPRILVVVFVPEQVADWTAHSEHELALRHCAYWTSLRGQPASANRSSTTVYLLRTNVFNAQGLASLMDLIGRGELP